jgi:CHAT domain-containing protein
MENALFLQDLRNLSLEEGRTYIQTHAKKLADPAAIGILIAEEAFRQRGIDPFVSLKLAELLVFFGEYVHHTSSHALGLKTKGDTLQYIGHHQAALKCLDAAGAEFLCLGDEVGWAHSRINWITTCAWLGSVEEALQAAARARDVFLRHGEDFWACAVDISTAMIYKQMGQYQKALDLYERMLAIYPTLSDQSESYIKRAIAIAENNQAINLSLLGNFERAYRLLHQAQASFAALEETSFVITTEINLADLDYVLGYYGSSLQRYYQARDSFLQNNLDDPHMLTEIMLRMAACLVKLNRAHEACQLAAEAVEIFKRLDTSLDTGDALREYATTLVASGRPKDALLALDEAWTLFTRGGFDHQATATRLQQVELLLEMGSVTDAYEQASFIKQYFDTQGSVARSIRASLVMAGALIEMAQQAGVRRGEPESTLLLEEAESLCEEATRAAHQHNLQEQDYKSQYLLGRLFVLRESVVKASSHYEAAIDRIEHILGDLAYDLGPSFLHTAWAVYEDMIALCLQQTQPEYAFGYIERARSMVLRQYLDKLKASPGESEGQDGVVSTSVLRTQHELELKEWQTKYRKYSAQLVDIDTSLSGTVDRAMIRAELKRCEAKLSELFERLHLHQPDTGLTFLTRNRETLQAKQVDIAQLRQQLAPDQLMLAYFLYRGRLVIFAVSAEHLITYEHPDGGAQLERLLPLLHAHLQPRGWRNVQRPPQLAIRGLLNKLYNLLVAPVAALLPPPPGLITIVPYGPLHKLPFQALYNGSHFLIEDFQINYLPAASILLHLGTRGSEQKMYSIDKGMATRPPLVFGYSGNGHLQRALEEAKMLTALLGGNCYLEEDATIARLVEQAPGSPTIHVATHGHSRLDAPNFSYIRLADGQLNALDAFRLDLKGCELVTLSGCETGLAFSSGGDEQLGLGRAFLAAGVASLVMSLWSVEDNATNELMQLFYQRLLSGDTKVQALRAAQYSLLQQTSSVYTHPYFWAAFRLVGDAGPLNRVGAILS